MPLPLAADWQLDAGGKRGERRVHGTYMGNNRILVNLVWGGLLLAPADDLSVSPILMVTGAFEPSLTKYLLKNVKQGAVAFDLGAHVGYYSILLARKVGETGRVVSYEANPATCAFLRDNININYVKNHTVGINKAIYSSAGTLTFHVTERFNCNASIYPREETYLRDHVDTIREITVAAEALDRYQGEVEHIDLIKMDVEGAEYHAFRGMQGFLRRRAIDTVVFEFAPTMLRDDTRPLYGILNDLQPDYGFFLPNTEGDSVPVTLEAVFNSAWVPAVIMKRRPGVPSRPPQDQQSCVHLTVNPLEPT